MIEIYSNVNKEQINHIIFSKSDFVDGRTDIIGSDNFLQCSALKLNNGTTFKPHKHVYHTTTKDNVIAQESWVVISGEVLFMYYDIDNTFGGSYILQPGDISVTLFGGHNYEILDDNTLIYEYKTGPYLGQELDKEFI